VAGPIRAAVPSLEHHLQLALKLFNKPIVLRVIGRRLDVMYYQLAESSPNNPSELRPSV
jgi:hypothetical protein